MKLESKETVNAPVDYVYRLVRDEMPTLVAYLPNIRKIEVKERRQMDDSRTSIVNHWYAKGEIPAIARKFVSPELLSWKDAAAWDDQAMAADYVLESFIAPKLFEVRGRTAFRALADGRTELSVSCELEIHPDRLPGVPGFLAAKAKPLVEEIVGKMLMPNLTSLSRGLNRYLAEQPKS